MICPIISLAQQADQPVEGTYTTWHRPEPQELMQEVTAVSHPFTLGEQDALSGFRSVVSFMLI